MRVPSITRRDFVSSSLLGSGLALAGSLQQATAAGTKGTAKSVIMIFNCGAPSHIDLWDPKPDATDTVRGPYRPIETSVPGTYVSELLPRLARQAHRYSIVRSVHHGHGSHNGGMHWSIVGRPYRIDSTLITPSRTDIPSFGTLTGWLARRDGYSGALPPYVITPAPHCDSTVYLTPGQFGGCLGAAHDPFVLNADPNDRNFQVPNLGKVEGITADRRGDRRALLEDFQRASQCITSDLVEGIDANQSKALALMESASVGEAFDLTREPASVRERYGRHTWGQSHLLARRLVEAGVRFVSTVNGQSIVWDTHKDNFNQLQKRLVPPMERAFDALIDDLAERGLLDTTLVIWMGDFGRTPKINAESGRDHWPGCYSVVLAGGGIRGGQVIGESDKIGARPKARPITPADLHATVFAALGYDSQAITFHGADGRPYQLSEGTPIRELLG